jgi:hypothetical protein
VVVREFHFPSGQTNVYKISIWCFSCNATLLSQRIRGNTSSLGVSLACASYPTCLDVMHDFINSFIWCDFHHIFIIQLACKKIFFFYYYFPFSFLHYNCMYFFKFFMVKLADCKLVFPWIHTQVCLQNMTTTLVSRPNTSFKTIWYFPCGILVLSI